MKNTMAMKLICMLLCVVMLIAILVVVIVWPAKDASAEVFQPVAAHPASRKPHRRSLPPQIPQPRLRPRQKRMHPQLRNRP